VGFYGRISEQETSMADFRSPLTADPRRHNGSASASITGPAPARGFAAALGRRVAARLPAADLTERDPDYIRRTLPGLWLLASYYFRADVRGLHHVPEQGPVLLVGNHSGGNVPADTFVFTLAFSAYFGADRPFYQLAHNLVMVWPGLGFLRRYGTIAAAPENAARALDSGAAVLVYPGGDYETHRPSWESARVDFGRRHGFIALALERGLPIVPVVSIGGQETAMFLARGERLAHALALDRAFHLHVLPVSLALPWGVNVGDLLGHVPLPAKITVQVLPPIDVREVLGACPDVDEAYDHVVGVMQRALDDLAAVRRLPIIG
jgi:1-acyl-sn-glycerol-3-phosphate acyltransferase